MTSKEMIIPMMMRLRAVAYVMASVHAWDALTISLWTHRLFVVAGLAGCCYMHLQIVLYASRVPVAGAGHHFVKDAGQGILQAERRTVGADAQAEEVRVGIGDSTAWAVPVGSSSLQKRSMCTC